MGQALSFTSVRQDSPKPSSTRPSLRGLCLDRDISLIEFHRRVFDEARDPVTPLLERAKFLGILGTITDESLVTRHGSAIKTQVQDLLEDAQRYLTEALAPALASEGIHLAEYGDLQPKERDEVERYFVESVLPLLMPLGFDAARPFPHISSRATALAVVVRTPGGLRLACLEVPDTLPGTVPFHWRQAADGGPSASRPAALQQGYVWLTDVISQNLAAVFSGMEIVAAHRFRVFRDEGLECRVTEEGRLRDAVEEGLRHREFGDVLTLAVSQEMPPALVELLRTNLGLAQSAVLRCRSLTHLARLDALSSLDRPDLRYSTLTPHRPSSLESLDPNGDIFAAIRAGDVLLHHPFDSFEPVVDLIARAAADPDVLAISTTLYRVGRNSPVVEALLNAAHAQKQVRVVMELRARFDEGQNLAWSRALENAGAHVVHGMLDLKVHAKLTMIVRREGGKLRRYVHLSSGNYNAATSTVYSDLALLSCNDELGRDATDLFNVLTGYASPSGFRAMLVSPFTLRQQVTHLIDREMLWAAQGCETRLILKMNALADLEIIESLYRASQAGVHVDLIVRGICCLCPGIPGVSDNIRVRSIVGRFLEHSRVWYFRNGGNDEIYLGSADLTPRNLNERVEVMARIDDAGVKQRIRAEILATYLADNVKARELTADGTYRRVGFHDGEARINSQERLL